MRAIWKYPLAVVARQTIGIPGLQTVLCAQKQNSQLTLWVVVDTDREVDKWAIHTARASRYPRA